MDEARKILENGFMTTWMILGFADAAAPSAFAQFLPLILVFGIFYFLVIAPMRKRQKALQAMVEALSKGDKVVTNGGIYGEVAGLDADTLILKIADNVKIRIAKSAITGLAGDSDKGKG